MYTTDERILLVHHRSRKLHHLQERRLLHMLALLCMALSSALLMTFTAVSHGAIGGMWLELYGTALMFSGAGGYVLTSVITFTIAVIITILGLRYKEKSKRNMKNFEEEKL